MSGVIRADKAYAVTGDGKIVSPSHPLARQILSHEAGQEVPANLMLAAGLAELAADGRGEARLKPREYDEVTAADVAAVMDKPQANPSATAVAPPAPTVVVNTPEIDIASIVAHPDVQKAIQSEVSKQVAAALKKAQGS